MAKDTFQTLPLQGYDVILGMPWFQRHQPYVDFKQHSVSLQAGPEAHTIPCLGTRPVETPETSGLVSAGEFESMAHREHRSLWFMSRTKGQRGPKG